jgi:hypothetical protein
VGSIAWRWCAREGSSFSEEKEAKRLCLFGRDATAGRF